MHRRRSRKVSAFTQFGGNSPSPRATGKGFDLTADGDKENMRLLPDGDGDRWHDEQEGGEIQMEGGDEDENQLDPPSPGLKI